jgi:hypothetical protein
MALVLDTLDPFKAPPTWIQSLFFRPSSVIITFIVPSFRMIVALA